MFIRTFSKSALFSSVIPLSVPISTVSSLKSREERERGREERGRGERGRGERGKGEERREKERGDEEIEDRGNGETVNIIN